MKNYLSLITILFLFASNAQKSNELDKLPVEVSPDHFTAREVGFMAIFPGCETVDVNDKANLQKCLAKELNIRLGAKFENFAEELDKKGLTSAAAKLQFVIDKSGKIIQVKKMSGGNEELGNISQKALIEISNEIGKISPATLDDGMPVNLVFQLPVKYVVQESKINEIEWSEFVVQTIKSESQKFEVRKNKTDTNFKIYEISSNGEEFLGNFKSWNEIVSLEPYKTLLNSQIGRTLYVEKSIDGIHYKLYFSENNGFIDVYKVINEKEEYFESLSQNDLEYNMVYLKLILR